MPVSGRDPPERHPLRFRLEPVEDALCGDVPAPRARHLLADPARRRVDSEVVGLKEREDHGSRGERLLDEESADGPPVAASPKGVTVATALVLKVATAARERTGDGTRSLLSMVARTTVGTRISADGAPARGGPRGRTPPRGPPRTGRWTRRCHGCLRTGPQTRIVEWPLWFTDSQYARRRHNRRRRRRGRVSCGCARP
jgi:hypothetical protein